MNEIDKKPAAKEPDGDKQTNVCRACNKTITGGAYKFKCHMFQHRAVAARFSCNFCCREFFRSDAYQRHLSKHTGDYKNLFTCDFCDRSFIDKRNLHKHLKVHSDSFTPHPKVKIFRCLACNITYTEERCLKHHIRQVHYNLKEKEPKFVRKPLNDTWVERVLESNTCVQVTKLNNNVIAIKKCESNKEVAKDTTDTCGSTPGTVNQYSKAICDYCKKEMLKKSLRQHIKERHMKIRNFKCKVCQNTFNRHYQLADHVCGKQRRKKRGTKVKGNK